MGEVRLDIEQTAPAACDGAFGDDPTGAARPHELRGQGDGEEGCRACGINGQGSRGAAGIVQQARRDPTMENTVAIGVLQAQLQPAFPMRRVRHIHDIPNQRLGAGFVPYLMGRIRQRRGQ